MNQSREYQLAALYVNTVNGGSIIRQIALGRGGRLTAYQRKTLQLILGVEGVEELVADAARKSHAYLAARGGTKISAEQLEVSIDFAFGYRTAEDDLSPNGYTVNNCR